MPESERCMEVAPIRMHQGFGVGYWYMRLRLMDGGTEFAVLEVQSATALAEAIAGLHGARHARPDAARPLQVHLWYNEAWWNLSDDLSQFFAWVIETGAATLGETRAFAADPLCRPDWLFEAARQMKKLLDVASGVPPMHTMLSRSNRLHTT